MSATEPKTKIDFMGMGWMWIIASIVLILFCVYEWFSTGTDKYGIDFLGGTEVVVRFDQDIKISDIRKSLSTSGITSATVQSFESDSNEFSIRVKGTEVGNTSTQVGTALSSLDSTFEVLKEDYVGPVIGDKIKKDGFKALIFAVIILLAYISWRFEFRYALGAVVAVAHDVFIAAGVFILFGGEIGASALAALLTILGYSVNDTIIVFDRIRENMLLKMRSKSESKVGSLSLKDMSPSEIINLSINQTLSRTLLTSGTTLFTCFSLWLLGGGAISDLAFILTIGILIGTFSSIFIASPIILAFSKK